MQPTKLPDDLFPADDHEWQRADYAGRVALLLQRYERLRKLLTAREGLLGPALVERNELAAEVQDLRERLVALVSEIERMHREQMTTHPTEGAGK